MQFCILHLFSNVKLIIFRYRIPRPSATMPEAANKSDLGQVAETHAMEQEFLWTCTLTGETKEFLWNPEVRLELLA